MLGRGCGFRHQEWVCITFALAGPIKFADMSGLDTILDVTNYMHERTGHPVYKPPRILEEMVEKGVLGQKTGRGFYEYTADEAEKFRVQTGHTIIKVRKMMEEM